MKKAFTFIEMIFVIVAIGILAKFGSEIFRNVYLNYTQSTTNNRLQSDTQSAIEQISNRLQYRIKNSVIARNKRGLVSDFKGLASASSEDGFDTLEWIGYDIDGWLGDASTTPTWSGFIDVDNAAGTVTNLVSPKSDFTTNGRIDSVIKSVSYSSDITDAAIFFTGANSNALTDFGWNTTLAYEQNNTAAHRIKNGGIGTIIPATGDDFSGVDVYEQYKLSWTAYAIVHTADGNLTLYYDYQPWKAERFSDGKSSLLMQNVSTFKFQGVGDMIKLQICVNDNNITGDEGYVLCKEKTIF